MTRLYYLKLLGRPMVVVTGTTEGQFGGRLAWHCRKSCADCVGNSCYGVAQPGTWSTVDEGSGE